MGEKVPQTLENHARLDPPFHFVAAPVLMIQFLVAVWNLWKTPGIWAAWMLVLSAAGVVSVFLIRVYALKVQDRVIRLEERMRMEHLLPEATRKRTGELTEKQLVALRFASDDELPDLVEKTLAGGLAPADIKKSIRQWRADTFRV